jgi:two-component system, NarL family, response regulator NreC
MTSAALTQKRTLSPDSMGVQPPPAPIDIVLAYRETLVRSGLRMLLNSEEEFTVVAEAEDLRGARRSVTGHHPKVLVLDLDLNKSDSSAITAILLIRAESPETEIVVVSLDQDVAVVREAVAAGALGYLTTSATGKDLIEAVRRAASGQAHLPPLLLAAIARPPQSGPADLSSHEVELLRLIVMGFTNPEVAERQFLSVRTIESHRAAMQMKLGHLTRAELVAYAVQHGIDLDGSGRYTAGEPR